MVFKLWWLIYGRLWERQLHSLYKTYSVNLVNSQRRTTCGVANRTRFEYRKRFVLVSKYKACITHTAFRALCVYKPQIWLSKLWPKIIFFFFFLKSFEIDGCDDYFLLKILSIRPICDVIIGFYWASCSPFGWRSPTTSTLLLWRRSKRTDHWFRSAGLSGSQTFWRLNCEQFVLLQLTRLKTRQTTFLSQ